MAARESEIQELRAQLHISRCQLHEVIEHLETQFNVKRRMRSQVAEHPFVWVGASVIAGFAAAKLVPGLLRGAGMPLVRGLLPMVLRAATMFVPPLLAHMHNAAPVKPGE